MLGSCGDCTNVSFNNQPFFHTDMAGLVGHVRAMDRTLAEKLKAIHHAAGKLSTRKAADAIGVPHTSYSYYLSKDYKKDTIPRHLAERMVEGLVPLGASKDDIMAIAQAAPDMGRLKGCIRALHEIAEESGITLDADQMAFLSVELYQSEVGEDEPDRLRRLADILVIQMMARSRA